MAVWRQYKVHQPLHAQLMDGLPLYTTSSSFDTLEPSASHDTNGGDDCRRFLDSNSVTYYCVSSHLSPLSGAHPRILHGPNCPDSTDERRSINLFIMVSFLTHKSLQFADLHMVQISKTMGTGQKVGNWS